MQQKESVVVGDVFNACAIWNEPLWSEHLIPSPPAKKRRTTQSPPNLGNTVKATPNPLISPPNRIVHYRKRGRLLKSIPRLARSLIATWWIANHGRHGRLLSRRRTKSWACGSIYAPRWLNLTVSKKKQIQRLKGSMKYEKRSQMTKVIIIWNNCLATS